MKIIEELESTKMAWVLSYVQGGRTCNEYIQEFKKIIRESGYKRQSLIEEFERGLSKRIRRKLVEAESLSLYNRGVTGKSSKVG